MSNSAVVFLDSRPKGFPGLEIYFQYAKMMRMAPFADDLCVEKCVPLYNMDLVSLSITMAQFLSKGQNAVIYTHAEPNNFVFPIDSTKPKNDFDVKEAANLSYHLDLYERESMGNQTGIIDPFLAQAYAGYIDPFHKTNFYDKSPDYLKVKKVLGEMMMDKMVAIRKLKLNHLAIRACRIGLNKDFMRFLGKLFGAKQVSAPMLRTAAVLGPYRSIWVAPEKKRQEAFALINTYRHGVGGRHVYRYANPLSAYGVNDPLVFTFKYTQIAHSSFQLSDIGATTEEAIGEFLWRTAGYDAFLSTVKAGGAFAAHALLGPTNLIFPGEAEYLRMLKFVQL